MPIAVLLALTFATPQAAPAAPAASTAAAPAPAPATRFSLDTPIETLLADAQANTVVEGVLPGIAGHPSYEMFKGMSFNQVAPLSNGVVTAEMLAKLQAGLTAIK